MAFRSVNLNPPRGPRGGGGFGGRGGGGSYRGGGGSGYNTPPPVRIDASGRVDQGFGPVGGASADPDFDIFGIDEPPPFGQQQQQSQPILYDPLISFYPLPFWRVTARAG